MILALLTSTLVLASDTTHSEEPVVTAAHYRLDADMRIAPNRLGLDAFAAGTAPVHLHVGFDLDCVAIPGRHRELLCSVDEADLSTTSTRPDVRRWFDLAGQRLPDTLVEVSFSDLGKLRWVDIQHDPALAGPQDALIDEVISRSVAGLDLERPASADSGSWRQNQTALLPAPTPQGPLARSALTHTLSIDAAARIRIETTGRMTWLEERPSLMGRSRVLASEVSGSASVDPAHGLVLHREWAVRSPGGAPFEIMGAIDLVSMSVQPRAFLTLSPNGRGESWMAPLRSGQAF